jgi:hypothetical protein
MKLKKQKLYCIYDAKHKLFYARSDFYGYGSAGKCFTNKFTGRFKDSYTTAQLKDINKIMRDITVVRINNDFYEPFLPDNLEVRCINVSYEMV